MGPSLLLLGRLLSLAGVGAALALGLGPAPDIVLLPLAGVIGAGVWIARKAQRERAEKDYGERKRVLEGAVRLVESEKALDDTRLASFLGMDVEDVARHVDFGMSRGFLPADPSRGMPAPGMGHLLAYLEPTPLGLKWFHKPLLKVGFEVCSRRYGCHLMTLEPGPKPVVVEMRYRTRYGHVTRRSSTSVLIREGTLTALYFTPSPWGAMAAGKLEQLGD
ncbi:MAG: hypothetical protein R6U36_02445 [Candidatus Fermentibacteraceae bacterium]